MTTTTPQASPQYSEFSVSTRRKATRSSAACGCGVGDASGAQAAALAALASLATTCTNAANAVNQNPLGRYDNSGSCTYDCGFMEQTWSWWADYRPTNANLVQAVGLCNITAGYGDAFAPTQVWISKDLPQFSTAITGDLAKIAGIDQAIINAGGEITPQQQTDLNNAFDDLNKELQANLNEANGALQYLASFLSWDQGHTGDLQSTVTNSQAFIKQNATGIENDLIGQIACGAGDVQNTFNAMFTDVNNKFVAMQAYFNTVTSNLGVAVQAGSRVAGTFLVLQSDSTLVSQQVQQALSFPPTSALRTMHLNIAGQNWTDFVQEANTQLQA